MTTTGATAPIPHKPKCSLADLKALAWNSGRYIAGRSPSDSDIEFEAASIYATHRAHTILDGMRVLSPTEQTAAEEVVSQIFGDAIVSVIGDARDSYINLAIQRGRSMAEAGQGKPQMVLIDPAPEWNDISRENPVNPYGVEDIEGELAKEVDECHAPIALGLPIPDPVFLVDGFFERGEPYVLSGEGGIGKSFLSLDLAMAVASGGFWLGRETTRGEVVTLFAEDSDGNTRRRAQKLAELRGLTRDQTEGLHLLRPALFPNGAMLLDKDLQVTKSMRSLWSYMRRVQKTRKRNIDLLIVDSAARTFAGDHNDAACVMAYIEEMKKFTTAFGCAVIVLAHPPKNGGSDVAGSGQWLFGPRGGYIVRPISKDKAKSECVLECVKSNDKAPDDIRLIRNEFGLLQRKPNDVGGAKDDPRHIVLQLIDDLNKEPEQTDEEIKLKVEKFSAAGVTHALSRGSNRAAATVMARLHPAFTEKEYKAAIDALVLSGDLIEVQVIVGRTANRSVKRVSRLQRNPAKPVVDMAGVLKNAAKSDGYKDSGSCDHSSNARFLADATTPQNEDPSHQKPAPWKTDYISKGYDHLGVATTPPHSLREEGGGEELGVHDDLRVLVGAEGPPKHDDNQSQAPLLSKASRKSNRRGDEVAHSDEGNTASRGLALHTSSASPPPHGASSAKRARPAAKTSKPAKMKSPGTRASRSRRKTKTPEA